MIEKKEFAILALNLKNKVFVIYVVFVSLNSDIYLFCKALIMNLNDNKTFTSGFSNYTDFVDVFSKDLTTTLLKLSKSIIIFLS